MPRSPEAIAAAPAAEIPLVAIAVDRVDWHARELAAALRAEHARAVPIRLSACGFTSENRSGLRLDRLDGRLPDAVIVRSVPGGTFEAVTLRLGVLHALREIGIRVFSEARAIERCVDKSMTSFLLARAGVATPATWAFESEEAARAIVRREAVDRPLVLKPLFGSQGRGLQLIRNESDLPAPAAVAGVYYLQQFVGVQEDGFRDFRLLVSRGRVVAAMMRHSAGWITNIKRGGRPTAAVVDSEMKELAVRAAAAVGVDFAGVDIVVCADGRPMVLEVNSMPSWSGLQRVTPERIAAIIGRDLMAELGARAGREAAM
jgi:tetrahydromethanopterin:alpha-L-glutamate ligase